jgi:hypothetical protein
MLTTAELSIFRSTQVLRFDLTATVTRPAAGTDDGEGGKLPASPTTFTSACCRAAHKAADREEVVAAKIQGRSVWDITFPALTDVRLTDRITIEGKDYEVISLYAPKSRETARMILAVERG